MAENGNIFRYSRKVELFVDDNFEKEQKKKSEESSFNHLFALAAKNLSSTTTRPCLAASKHFLIVEGEREKGEHFLGALQIYDFRLLSTLSLSPPCRLYVFLHLFSLLQIVSYRDRHFSMCYTRKAEHFPSFLCY